MCQTPGKERVAVLDGVTRLSPARAIPARVRAVVRGQGQLEHQAHGGRAGTCAAERSQVRCGHMPQGMVA